MRTHVTPGVNVGTVSASEQRPVALAPPPTLAVDSTTLASAKVLFFTNTSLVESSFDHTTSHTMTFTARDRVWTNLGGLATSRPRGRLTARDEP